MHLSRNDPVNDPWWDKQEAMTTSMKRHKRPATAPATDEPSITGDTSNQILNQTPSTLDETMQDSLGKSQSQVELQKSVNFDPKQPLPWDEDTVMGRALRKVADSAVHYNREKDGVYINAFRGGAMTPEAFRLELRRSLNIKLTDREFQEVISAFDADNDGTINGSEFLVQYTSIGFREKSRRAAARRERERKKVLADRVEAKRKAIADEKKMEANITSDYSKTDLESALAKMSQVAGDYDACSASAMSLEGFLGTPLTPGNLRDMLRRTFNLRLAGPEVGALFAAFDSDGGGTLDGSEFLMHFKKLGFNERARRMKLQRENTTAMNKHFEKLAEEREAAKQKASDNSVSFKFTSEDSKRALQKLSSKSADYDPSSSSALALDSFQGASMTPKSFRDLCNIILGIKFSPPEMGAIMEYFDGDKGGTIDGSEFLVKFTQLGFAEKQNRFQMRKEFDERKAAKEKAWNDKREKAAKDEQAKKVKVDFTSEDWTTAMQKITAAAADYDKCSASAMSLQAFQGSALEPPLFRDMVFRTFGVTLTPGEAGAVIKYFDKDGDGTIDGTEFLLLFTKLGFNEKTRRRDVRKKEKERRDQEQKKWWENKQRELEEKNKNTIDRSFTDAHKELALGKIAECAVNFEIDEINRLALQAFQGSSMEPHVFKEQLRKTFHLNVSPGELGAIIDIFDKDGDGTVDGAEFLNQFFKIKHSERDRRTRERKEKEERYIKAQEAAAAKIEADRIAKLKERLKFTANDRISALKKIKDEALRFDRTAANSMGLGAFTDGPPMDADVLRKNLHKTFASKFSYPEVGALMLVFDKDGEGLIDGAEFLAKFFSIVREEQKRVLGDQKKARPKTSTAPLSGPPKKEKTVKVDIGIQAPDDLRPRSSPEKMPRMTNNVGTSNEDDPFGGDSGSLGSFTEGDKIVMVTSKSPVRDYEPISTKIKEIEKQKRLKKEQDMLLQIGNPRPSTSMSTGGKTAPLGRISGGRAQTAAGGSRATTAPMRSSKSRAGKSRGSNNMQDLEEEMAAAAKDGPVFYFPTLIIANPIIMPSPMKSSNMLR
jgi:Ca2+-binding EF-hand superfamily protein